MQKIGTSNFQQTSMATMQKNLKIGSNEGNTKQWGTTSSLHILRIYELLLRMHGNGNSDKNSWWKYKLIQPLWKKTGRSGNNGYTVMLGYSHFRSPPWRGDKTAVQESMNKDTLQHCSDFLDSSVGKEYACNAGEPASIPGWGRSSGEGIGYPLQYSWASFVAHLLKNPPTV